MADVLFSFATRFVQVSCTNLLRVYQRYKCSFALAALISMHACFSGMSLYQNPLPPPAVGTQSSHFGDQKTAPERRDSDIRQSAVY